MLEKIYSASAGTGKTEIIVKTFLGIEDQNISVDKYIQDNLTKNNLSEFIENLKSKLKNAVFISFSNAAADEIKSRLWKSINKILQKQKEMNQVEGHTAYYEDILPAINVFTIHSFCLRVIKILRHVFLLPVDIDFLPQLASSEETTLWGLCIEEYFDTISDENILKFFQLIDEKNCKNFLKRYGFLIYALDQLGYFSSSQQQEKNINDDQIKKWIKLKEKIEEIEENRGENLNQLNQDIQDINDYLNFLDNNGKNIFLKILKDVYKRYLKKIYNEGVIDYDTAVFLVTKKIKELGVNEFFELLKNNGWKIKEIYLDEAQDSDIIQNDFVIRICNHNKEPKIYVVGDYKQSIYQWRDAYPEEFQELIEEVRKNPDDNVRNKYQSLQTTRRIRNENTLQYINEVFEQVKNRRSYWGYERNNDELQKPSDVNLEQDTPLIKMCSISSNFVFSPDDTLYSANNAEYSVKDIFSPSEQCKKIGVLVRSRSDLKPIKQIIDGLDNVRYRIQESTTLEELADDIEDFFPEYLIIRTLFLLFDEQKIWLLPYFLYFTYPGRVVLKKILDDKNNNKLQTNDIEIFKELFERINKIKKDYMYQKYVPAIYDIIYKYKLWEIMSHDGLPQNRKYEIIRQIDSYLGLIYIFEKKQLSFRNNLNLYLETPILPYEWGTLPDNEPEHGIIEISTIHSAKGLTYDRVIVIADFWKDFLKDSADFNKDKEKFEYLFNIKFNNLLTNNPNLEINFFPYIVMKYILRENRKEIEQDKFKETFSRLITYFDEVKNKINIEKLNLLYVALTRTRRDIIMINNSGNAENVKTIFINNQQICESLYISPRNVVQSQQFNIKYKYKIINLLNCSDIKPPYTVTAVRETGKFEKSQKLEEGIGAWKNYQYIEIGKTLHEILRNFVEKKTQLDDIISYLAKDNKEFIDNIQKNSQDSFNKIKNVVSKINKIFAEVPIWSKDKTHNNDINIVRGTIDCFYIENNKFYLYEYKTIFVQNKEEKQQVIKDKENMYNNQVTKYRQMLNNVLGLTTHNEDNLVFFTYLNENI